MTLTRTLSLSALAAAVGLTAAVSLPATTEAQPRPPGDLEYRCRDLTWRDGYWQGYCRDPRGDWRWTTVRTVDDGWGGDRWDDRRPDDRWRDDRPDERWNDGRWDNRRWDDRRWDDDRWGSQPGWSSAQSVTVYEERGFRGRSITLRGEVPDLRNSGLNDRISSLRGQGDWEVCTDADFRGDCRVFRGDVADLGPTNFNDKISSLRPARPTPRW